MMKVIFIAFGFMFCAVGGLGVLLPVLPTTPFLMLSAFCFAKGSQRFHRWFISTKLYQKHLDSFMRDRTMTLKTKLCILLPVSLMLGLAFFMMNNWLGRIMIILLVVFKYYYFFSKIRTIPVS